MMFEQPRYRPNGNVYSNAPQYGYREQLAEDLHQLILDLLGDPQTRVIPMLSAEHQFDMAGATLDAHPEPTVGPFLDDLNRVATLLDYISTLELAVQLAQQDPQWRYQLTPVFQGLYPLLNSLYDEAQPRLAAERLDSRHVGLIWRLRYITQDYLEQVLGWQAVHGDVADSPAQSTASASTMGSTSSGAREVVTPSQLKAQAVGGGESTTGEKIAVPGNSPPASSSDDSSSSTKTMSQNKTETEARTKQQEIKALIDKSPTLQNNLRELSKQGWKISAGPPGQGSYANRNADPKLIVIDQNLLQHPEAYVQTLAHESGHALYSPDPYVEFGNLTRDEYVSKNAMSSLKDEGEATLVNLTVREEILSNDGTDIGVAGTQGNKYIAVYEKYQKNGDRDAARKEIGKIFADNERPSTNPSKTYRQYYSEPYEDHWDKYNQ